MKTNIWQKSNLFGKTLIFSCLIWEPLVKNTVGIIYFTGGINYKHQEEIASMRLLKTDKEIPT